MAEKGRAAVFKGIRQPFELREFPLLDPEEGGLIVEITRTNLCGSDLHIWRGDTDLHKLGVVYPIILGHEMAGRVFKIGKNGGRDSLGQSLKEGDRIVYTYYAPCGTCRACLRGQVNACQMSLASPVRPCDMAPHLFGGFSTHYQLSPKQKVFKVPDAVGDKEVAGANCALAQVVYGFQQVKLGFGETVVVQGAGGLGLYACAVAKDMGAQLVIAIDGVPARLELARQFGADHVIDVSSTEARARISEVNKLTGGWGADVVAELVGFPQVVPEGIRMLGRGGRYLEMGNINPKMTYEADPSIIVGNNISIHGVSLYEPLALKQSIDFLARTKHKYPFEKMCSHAFVLDKIDEAFAEADIFAKDKKNVTRASITPNAKA